MVSICLIKHRRLAQNVEARFSWLVKKTFYKDNWILSSAPASLVKHDYATYRKHVLSLWVIKTRIEILCVNNVIKAYQLMMLYLLEFSTRFWLYLNVLMYWVHFKYMLLYPHTNAYKLINIYHNYTNNLN